MSQVSQRGVEETANSCRSPQHSHHSPAMKPSYRCLTAVARRDVAGGVDGSYSTPSSDEVRGCRGVPVVAEGSGLFLACLIKWCHKNSLLRVHHYDKAWDLKSKMRIPSKCTENTHSRLRIPQFVIVVVHP